MSGISTLFVALALSVPMPEANGTIEGSVINASDNDKPVAGAEVILQVQLDGQFTAVEQVVADSEGRYRFEALPVGDELIYLPGANRDGVHYPGRRIQLNYRRPTAYVTLQVHNGVANPNPLVIRQHEVVIHGEPGVLHVVEAMLIDNPGRSTFIGQAEDGAEPVTMQLGIPTDFERLTFEKEFFGRQFRLDQQRLVTSIPWLPGQQWLRYTYSIPHEDSHRTWQRTLSLPCENLRVRVKHEQPEKIACNLPAAANAAPGEVIFETADGLLLAGEVVQVELGQLPVPWMVYARWTAVLVLLALIAGVCAALVLKRHRDRAATTRQDTTEPSETGPAQEERRHGPHAPPRQKKPQEKRQRVSS